ncbi:MAG: outer membrane protein OmpA-like peptidoglycan-associated protein [Neolewinella sp.]|jgi:outer membrane protein OmpA-like peptidoglycan-associated protein
MKDCLFFLLFILLSSVVSGQGTLLTQDRRSDIDLENCARINDKKTQFGPAIYGNQLVFLTRPKRGNMNPITRETYFKLFKADLTPDGDPGYPKPFSVELSGNYNEGPISFTQDDRVVFFTRTLQKSGTTTEDLSGKTNLGIYSAYRAEYDWAGIRPLPFNGPNFSNQHPSVTPNGKRVFFASNREGGYGGYDLYFSDFREGLWSPAINMGPDINTEGNEAFPYIHANGRLFFASDGHGGQGGYDLFLVDLSQRRWGKLLNLPSPINSSADDVGIVLTKDASRGYMVSNREEGKGKDDIYLLRFARGFSSLEASRTDGEVVTIYDGSTSQRVTGAEVWLAENNNAGRLPAEFYSFSTVAQNGRREISLTPRPYGALLPTPLRTDREGTLRLELKVGTTYEMRVFRRGYRPETLRFVYTENGPSRPLEITLQPISCLLVSGRITTSTGEGAGNVPIQFRPQGCPSASISGITDIAGYYEVCLSPDCNYMLSAGRLGFETGVSQIKTTTLQVENHPSHNLVLKHEGGLARRGTDADEAVLPLPGITFYGNTAVLNEENSGDLDILAQLLTARADVKLLLIAHTDGPGDQASLQRLGNQRSVNLREALLRRGVAPDRLRTISYGQKYRARECGECTVEDYAFNNRIEAKVISW